MMFQNPYSMLDYFLVPHVWMMASWHRLICWWDKIDVFWDQWLAQLFRFQWPALSPRVPSTVLLDVLPCVRKWSSIYKTFFIWKNYQTILQFFFTHTYLTKTGSTEWVAVSEDKEVWLEESRIINNRELTVYDNDKPLFTFLLWQSLTYLFLKWYPCAWFIVTVPFITQPQVPWQ